MSVDLETTDRVATTLVHVVKIITGLRHSMQQPVSGVEASAYPALFTLAQGPVRVSALAERVHSDVSTTSRQVSSLVADGLVTKLPDPDDGRAQLVGLTDQGRTVVAEVKAARSRWFQELMGDWTQEEGEAFDASLGHLLTNILERHRDILDRPDLFQQQLTTITMKEST